MPRPGWTSPQGQTEILKIIIFSFPEKPKLPWQKQTPRSASQSRYRSRLRGDRSSWDCEAFSSSSLLIIIIIIIITWGRIWGSWTPSRPGCWPSWWWCSRPCRRGSARARSRLRASVHASQYLTTADIKHQIPPHSPVYRLTTEPRNIYFDIKNFHK